MSGDRDTSKRAHRLDPMTPLMWYLGIASLATFVYLIAELGWKAVPIFLLIALAVSSA